MGWTDYVPIVGPLAEGNFKGAALDFATGGLYTPVSGAANAYTGAIDKQKQGLDTAAAQARALGEKQRQFQMEGLQKAENYYLPAQAMNQAVYGTPDRMRK